MSIRDGAHSGLCPFGMVPIRDGAHSGLCPFGIVSIRDCVFRDPVFRDRVQDPILSYQNQGEALISWHKVSRSNRVKKAFPGWIFHHTEWRGACINCSSKKCIILPLFLGSYFICKVDCSRLLLFFQVLLEKLTNHFSTDSLLSLSFITLVCV